MATAGTDGTARLWSPDGTPGPVMQQPDSCRSVAWSPTGERFAVAADSRTTIWNRDGSKEIEIPGSQNSYSVDWNPTGKQLVVGMNDRTVRIWSEEGLLQAVMQEHDSTVYHVDWSPSGKLIASSASDCSIIVWDAQTSEPVWIGVQLGTGDSVTFSTAGQLVDGDAKVLEKHFVYLIETEDGKQELLKPSEFQKRITQSLHPVPVQTNHPQPKLPTNPDRRAAEWVLGIGGTVMVEAIPDIHQASKYIKIKSGENLQTAPFLIMGVELDNNQQLDDAGLVHLAKLKNIQQLYLQNTKLSDEGLRHLESLTSLLGLHLNNTQVTDVGLRHLSKMKKLQVLYLQGTKITDKGIEILAQLHAAFLGFNLDARDI